MNENKRKRREELVKNKKGKQKTTIKLGGLP